VNKIVPVIIALILVFSLSGTTFSAEKQKMKVFGGGVKAVNIQEKTITLWNDEVPEITFSVDDKNISKTTSGNKTLADIKIGDIAVVAYDEVNGKNVAKAVTVTSPEAASRQGKKAKPVPSEEKK
jgi:Cu/Ag efflux protein CusF